LEISKINKETSENIETMKQRKKNSKHQPNSNSNV